MIDEVYIANDVSAGPELLGVRLLPLSIWHHWALRAAESPFVAGGRHTSEDILNAVALCSLTKDEYAGLVQHGMFAGYLGLIAGDYLTLDEDGKQAVIDEFAAYWTECTQFPEFWSADGTDPTKDRLRCPIEWHLILALLDGRICQTEAEAWDYPIARAQCWQAVEGERAGSKNYVDQRDRDDFAGLEAEGNANG